MREKVHYERMIIFLLILFITTLIVGCSNSVETNAIERKEIQVVEAKQGEITGEISLTGILAPSNSVNVCPELTGKVTKVLVQKGDFVKKGQPLIKLDDEDLKIKYRKALANLEKTRDSVTRAKINYDSTKKDFERIKTLYEEGAISKQKYENYLTQLELAKITYESAESSGLDAAEASIESIKLQLSKTTIKSPINGVVVSVNVENGEMVSPGRPIVTVTSVDSIIFKSNVIEKYLNYLEVGQKAVVYSESVPGKTFEGKLSFISPVSTTTGQQFPIEITIVNSKGELKGGMTGCAKLRIKSSNSIVVPRDAILEREGLYYIFKVIDNKAIKKKVKLGIENEKYVSILEGVNEGDKIMIENVDKVIEGETVAIKKVSN